MRAGKAFRHGDIENVLEELAKMSSGMAAGGGLLGFAKMVIKQGSEGGKFSKSDIKKVYFVSITPLDVQTIGILTS
jgi:hypothetical protein